MNVKVPLYLQLKQTNKISLYMKEISKDILNRIEIDDTYDIQINVEENGGKSLYDFINSCDYKGISIVYVSDLSSICANAFEIIEILDMLKNQEMTLVCLTSGLDTSASDDLIVKTLLALISDKQEDIDIMYDYVLERLKRMVTDNTADNTTDNTADNTTDNTAEYTTDNTAEYTLKDLFKEFYC